MAKCGTCFGQGVIIEDLPGGKERKRKCSDCNGRGEVSNQRYATGTVLGESTPRAPAAPPVGSRYCEICGEHAGPGAIYRNGMTLHAGVCELWDLTTRAGDIVPGDVIASFRFMNYHKPLRVLQAVRTGPSDLTITAQRCHWDPIGDTAVQLSLSGEQIARNFPPAEVVPRALAALSDRPYPVATIPPEWLTAASVHILGRSSLAATAAGQ